MPCGGNRSLCECRPEGHGLVVGDAAELDFPFAVTIKLAINQHIHLGLVGNPFRLNVIFWKLLELEILHSLLRPRAVALSARATTGTGSRSFHFVGAAEP
jgi:hypothetical protein